MEENDLKLEDNSQNMAELEADKDTNEPLTLSRVIDMVKVGLCDESSALLYDSYLRTKAEYDNYRKRVLSDRDSDRAHIKMTSMEDLLEIKDSFDIMYNMTATTISDLDKSVLDKYISPIYNKINSIIEKNGITVIQNETFDSDVHECISMTDGGTNKPSGSILAVLSNGYKYKDVLLRPSKVIVQE